MPPGLFDDVPVVGQSSAGLFDDVPKLDTKQAQGLFDDVPVVKPPPEAVESQPPGQFYAAGQQGALKQSEQRWTPEKALLGAGLGAAQGVQELKRAGSGLAAADVFKSPLEEGVDLWNYFTGGKRNVVKEAREKTAQRMSDEATKESAALEAEAQDLSPGAGVQIPKAIGAGVVSTVPSLVVSLFGGLPAAAYGAGLQSFGATYDSAVRKYSETMPREEAKRQALMPAIASGLVTAGATRAFGGVERLFAKIGQGQLGKETLKGVLKQVVKSAGLEVPEEAIDQLGQGIIEQKSFNPDKPWSEILTESLVAGALGGGVGLLMGGVAAPSGAVINRLGRGQRLKQLRAERAARPPVTTQVTPEEQVRQDITDRIMSAGQPEGDPNAQRIGEAAPMDGPLLRPTVPQEGTGQVPTVEGSPGIPPRGQGETVQAATPVVPNLPTEPVPALGTSPAPLQLPSETLTVPTPPMPVSVQGQAIPIPEVSEMDGLLTRREQIKRKLLDKPTEPLSAEETKELIAVSRRVHELDPARITVGAPEAPRVGPSNPVRGVRELVVAGTTVEGALSHLAQSDSPFASVAKSLLEKADTEGRGVRIRLKPQGDPSLTSRYQPDLDEVLIADTHADDARVLLHEAIHALTFKKLPLALRVSWDSKEQYQTALRYAASQEKGPVKDLIDLYNQAVSAYASERGVDPVSFVGASAAEVQSTGAHYGLSNLDEFLTEASSNPEFQAWLKTARGKENFWQKLLRILKQILGINQPGMLERVMSLTEQVVAAERPTEVSTAQERAPEALVRDPSRRHDELVAQTELPSGQVREVNLGIHTQNYSVVGHALRSFQALPPEIQGLLPDIRTRFPAMADAQAALGGQAPQGDLATMVRASTSDPKLQQAFYFDAWQNIFDVTHNRAQMNVAVETARNELEAEQRKGGTDNNPTQQLISDATWHEINQLIPQRDAIIAQQGDPAPLNQRIKDLKQWMHETPFFRVAQAIAAGQPLNFQAIGASPAIGAVAAQVIQNYPGLAAAITAIQAAPQTAEVIAAQASLEQKEKALAWLDQLIASPEFRTNYQQAVDATGAEFAMVSETEANVTFLDPITKERVAVPFSSETGVIKDGQAKLETLLEHYHDYLNLPSAQRDPLIEAGVRIKIPVIENIYLNPAYSPDASGKVYVGTGAGRVADPFNLLTFGGNIATQESRIDRVGGMQAAIAQMRGQAYGLVAQQMRTKYEQMANGVALKVHAAIQSHSTPSLVGRAVNRLRRRTAPTIQGPRITSARQWMTEISDPVINSWQEQGSRHLRVGMKHMGRTINQLDWDAIQAQKQFVDAIARLPAESQTTMTRLFALKIKIGDEKALLPYFRDPQATGPLTMPRYATERAHTYAREWLEIQKEKDPVRQRQLFENYLGARGSTQAFIDLVIGHMRSATDVPSYARLINTPFQNQYRKMAQDYHEGNAGRVHSVTETLDRIFQDQNVAPEKLQTREAIADTFFAELTGAFNRFTDHVLTQNLQNAPRSDVKVTSADNFLTTPRGEQVLPSTLYQSSAADRDQLARAHNAVNEVLGQRFVESLQDLARTLTTTIEKFTAEVTELERQGMDRTAAEKQVQKQSRQAHLDGLNWFDYNEAQYQLSQINKSIEEMQKIAGNQRALENAEVRSGSKMIRTFFIGGILESVGVVWRNYASGPVKLIQQDWLFSKSIKVFNLSIPGGNLVVAPVRRYTQAIGNTFLLGILPKYAAAKFFATPTGKAIQAKIESNPQAYSAMAQWMYQQLADGARRYHQMESLGLAGGAPIGQQIEAYLKLVTSGGQIRSDDASPVWGTIKSVMGLAVESGLMSGHPGLPRNALARWADLSVNAMAGADVDSTCLRLQDNARVYLTQRLQAGHATTGSLTPEELVGNAFATRKEAQAMRDRWAKAGLNVDQKMIEYFEKVQAARTAGQTTDQIKILDDVEYNTLFAVYANAINKGSFMNRPAWLTTNEIGRTFGALRGYGLWDNSQYRYALSRFSKSKDPTNAEGVSNVLLFLFAAALGALSAEPLVKWLTMLFYREERQTPNPFKAESELEAAKAMGVWMAPFLPMVGGVANSLFTGVMRDGKVSMDFIPTSAVKSVMNTARAIVQTGDPVRPMTAFSRQWFPNTKIALNRLPYNEGLTDYYNVNRTLRANTPADIEVRQSSGGSYRFSSTSDNVQNVVNALSRSNGPDWELAMRERAIGIAEKAKQGIRNADRAFDAAVMAKTPYRAVYGRRLTTDETSRIESKLSEPQRTRLNRINSSFAGYRQRTGYGSGRTRSRTSTRGVRRVARMGRGIRSGRLRGLRRRSLRSSIVR